MDLVNYILKFNDDSKLILDWYIEKDFYNWLNCDLFDRSYLVLNRSEYLCIHNVNKLNYYVKNYDNLGLTKYKSNDLNSLRRDKSLSECFKTKWWKTTEKNFVNWDLIHIYINNFNL